MEIIYRVLQAITLILSVFFMFDLIARFKRGFEIAGAEEWCFAFSVGGFIMLTWLI